MGAFQELRARAIDFGAQQEYLGKVKDRFDVDDIEDILIEEARAILLRDLQTALGLLPSNAVDMDDLDAIVEAQESRMQGVLATLQTALVFEQLNEGPDSKTDAYRKEYLARYGTMKAGFGGLLARQGSTRVRTVANRR